MASQATSGPAVSVARPRIPHSLGAVLPAFGWSRAAVVLVAVAFAAAGIDTSNEQRFGDRALAGDPVTSPLARWDAVWYLRIADSGYGDADSPRTAFFPLYPLIARGAGELGGGSPTAVLIGAYAVALAALLAALALLFRLTRLELGSDAAAATVVVTCAFPASLFLGAPYSESLFLLASVAALLAARTGHWALAAAAAAAASGTRSAGVLLLVPLALLLIAAVRDGSARRRDAAWLLLAPLGAAAYAAYLALAHGDALAFVAAQELWSREFSGPLAGLRDGCTAAWNGLELLVAGAPTQPDSPIGSPARIAVQDLLLLGYLGFAVVATVGVARRLPAAYAAYVVAALMLPLSYPMDSQPLMSLPRFLVVLFPLFMWLGAVCAERGRTTAVAAVLGLGLAVSTAEFAAWRWVA
jgi:hypothetical protein